MGPRLPPLSSSQKPRLTEAEAAQVMRQLVEQQRQLKAQLQYHSLQVTAAGERGEEGRADAHFAWHPRRPNLLDHRICTAIIPNYLQSSSLWRSVIGAPFAPRDPFTTVFSSFSPEFDRPAP